MCDLAASSSGSVACNVTFSKYTVLFPNRYTAAPVCACFLVFSRIVFTKNQIVYHVTNAPMISLFTVVIALAFFWLWDKSVSATEVAVSFSSVMEKGEVWRVITASFSHLDLLHVGLNLSSLIGLVPLEIAWGSSRFFLLLLATPRSLVVSISGWW